MKREDATELYWALNELLAVQPEESLGPAHDAACLRACAILAVIEGRQPMRYMRTKARAVSVEGEAQAVGESLP